MKQKFIEVICRFFIYQLVLSASLSAKERPNIIVFLADDLGYGDCSIYNAESKINTPHIDQLASEGMLFTDAHSASTTCTPSRYGFLTGINPCRTGVLNTILKTGKPVIDSQELTIAEFLKKEGYSTSMIGKWHLGFEMNTEAKKPSFNFSETLKGGPVDCGFDYYYGVHSSASASPMFYIKNNQPVKQPKGFTHVPKFSGAGKESQSKIQISDDFDVTELSPHLTSEAVRLIKEHKANEKSKPFFLYFASTIPHQPWVPSKKFLGKSGLGLYGDIVMQLDDEMGQINKALKDTGLDKNTILIFTSDNGPGPGAHTLMGLQGHACSSVLKGMKSDAWEGGHRVPFIVKWPEKIKAGTVSNALVNGTDIFATIAEVLNVKLKKDNPQTAADSFSFYSVLMNQSVKHNRPAMIAGRHSIRQGEWKLVSKQKKTDSGSLTQNNFELYNLENDLGEEKGISKEHPERSAELFKQFKKFADSRKLKEIK